ncbi:MAG: DoxX family protein [Terriglobales bacterium]
MGAALLVQGGAYFVDWHGLEVLTSAVGLLMIVIAILLLIGYLSPFAAVMAAMLCVGSTSLWFPAPSLELFEAKLTAVLATVITVALVCLGPGAYSLDARLFGRREIIIPSPSPRS